MIQLHRAYRGIIDDGTLTIGATSHPSQFVPPMSIYKTPYGAPELIPVILNQTIEQIERRISSLNQLGQRQDIRFNFISC
jgi:hypothetical protein